AVELGGTPAGFGVASVAGGAALLVLMATQRVMATGGRSRAVAGSSDGASDDARDVPSGAPSAS
ncbi:MFS transporter, partial [Streptomyces sp. NPDC059538]